MLAWQGLQIGSDPLSVSSRYPRGPAFTGTLGHVDITLTDGRADVVHEVINWQ
ncbi:hypothetical protein ACWDKQ_27350 [Saccharopolyspora sp. NPDC000995]